MARKKKTNVEPVVEKKKKISEEPKNETPSDGGVSIEPIEEVQEEKVSKEEDLVSKAKLVQEFLGGRIADVHISFIRQKISELSKDDSDLLKDIISEEKRVGAKRDNVIEACELKLKELEGTE